MRVFAIPILKNKWAYYCHSTIPTTSRLTKVVNWSSKKWEELEQAKPDSIKKKIYTRGTALMNQLDYQEWFLKSVPAKEDIEKPLNKVHLYYPSLILQDVKIQAELKTLLKDRIPYHKKYMWYSIYWVPVSCLFGIVPLIPNIPLGYNLFRLYSHYKALKGAEHLQSIIDYGSLECVNEERLNELYQHIKLKDVTDIIVEKGEEEGEVEGAIRLDDVKNIIQILNVPGLELELYRARSQILKSIQETKEEKEK